jgi:ATP-dependent DNA ligase
MTSPLPTLYKKNERGKYQQWRVWADGDTVYTEYGQVAGKLRTVSRLCTVKNAGRSNATTPAEQALAEAKSKHREQQEKKLYSPTPPTPQSPAGAEAVATNEEPVLNVIPTLAHKYEDYPPKQFPVITQPKLDGLRCVASSKGEAVACTSRNHKEYVFLIALKALLRTVLLALTAEIGPCALDGELYTHALAFEKITSIGRKSKTPDPDENQLQYWLFDLITTQPLTYAERWQLLRKHIYSAELEELLLSPEPLRLLPYDEARADADIHQHHDRYVQLGFEGLMVRTPSAPYQHKRTRELLKLKNFYDEEATVVGAEEGEGVEVGCVVWVLTDAQGRRFKARPRGSHERRRQQYLDRDQYLGRQLTIRYQEKTADGIPRFPVGIDFRTDL